MYQYPNSQPGVGNNYGEGHPNAGVPVQPAYPSAAPGYSGDQSAGYPGGQSPAYPAMPPQPGYPNPNGGPWASPPPQRKGTAKVLFIVLGIILVLGLAGGGAAFYFLTRPNPAITITSTYTAGASQTPAGATGTTFEITGSQFSNNSAITFLLDGQTLGGTPATQSDAHGNIKVALPVTGAWAVGNHTLTARDASSYLTKTGVSVVIVNQGEAGTLGPNGSPTNSASFQLQVQVQPQDATTGAQLDPQQSTLAVTGPDGKVCDPKNDTGKPITVTTSDILVTYVATCSGTYKGGKISYTETLTSETFVLSSGISCAASNLPITSAQLEGSFTDAHTASGTYKSDELEFACSDGETTQSDPETGAWTGTLG